MRRASTSVTSTASSCPAASTTRALPGRRARPHLGDAALVGAGDADVVGAERSCAPRLSSPGCSNTTCVSSHSRWYSNDEIAGAARPSPGGAVEPEDVVGDAPARTRPRCRSRRSSAPRLGATQHAAATASSAPATTSRRRRRAGPTSRRRSTMPGRRPTPPAAPASRRSPGARTRPRRGGRARATGRDAPHRRPGGEAPGQRERRGAEIRPQDRARAVHGRPAFDGRAATSDLAQREAAVVGRDDAVGQHVEARARRGAGAARRSSSAFWNTPPVSADPARSRRRSRVGRGDGRRSRPRPRRGTRPRSGRRRRRARRSATIAREHGARVDARRRRRPRTGRRAAPDRAPGEAAASSSIAASASYDAAWRTPTSELTASNSRPMLDVGTHRTFRSSCRRERVELRARPLSRHRRQVGVPGDPGRAQVRERGRVPARRIAASPPGSGT